MLDFLNRLFPNNSTGSSKAIAKERLRLVLVHDRINVSPQFMECIKDDMIKVISNYMEINENEMEINLTTTNSSVSLVANIPVTRMRRGVTLED